MNTEDLFKYGVTPKEGALAGRKYEVKSINADGVVCQIEGKPVSKTLLKHGTYELYQEPKTLFEDETIKPTWGNLKKAMEAAGLDDDTLFVVPHTDWFARGYGWPATFSVEMLRQPYEKPKKHVVVR